MEHGGDSPSASAANSVDDALVDGILELVDTDGSGEVGCRASNVLALTSTSSPCPPCICCLCLNLHIFQVDFREFLVAMQLLKSGEGGELLER
jgi:hypothetical protein